MSTKFPICHVSVSNILRKDKHEHKLQEINNYPREMSTNKSINLIYHSKNIKHQHLNKSKLNLTMRGTEHLYLTTFVREIWITFNWQCILGSTDGKVTGSCNYTEYKSNSIKIFIETNHWKSLGKDNMNRLVFARLNINSIRNKF